MHLGADPNGTNDQGWTALHLAASKGHAAVARYLLHIGAQPGVQCQVPVWPKEVFTPLRPGPKPSESHRKPSKSSPQDRHTIREGSCADVTAESLGITQFSGLIEAETRFSALERHLSRA